jgi:hypothetical protein
MRVLILTIVLSLPGFAAGPAAALAEPAAKPAKAQKTKKTKAKKARSLFSRGAFVLGKVIMPDTGY